MIDLTVDKFEDNFDINEKIRVISAHYDEKGFSILEIIKNGIRERLLLSSNFYIFFGTKYFLENSNRIEIIFNDKHFCVSSPLDGKYYIFKLKEYDYPIDIYDINERMSENEKIKYIELKYKLLLE